MKFGGFANDYGRNLLAEFHFLSGYPFNSFYSIDSIEFFDCAFIY